MKTTLNLSFWLYRKLVKAFPDEFRLDHGWEMLEDTETIIREAAARQGTARLVWLSLRLLADAAVRLPVEHLRELAQDTQYAARLLLRSKGFTIASIISVGIGIGLGTTVFSQIESLMLKDIPTVSAPDELIASSRPVSYPDYERFRDESGQFSDMAAYMAPVPFVVREEGRSQRVWGHLVSPNYFDVLGTGASIGRTFGEPERAQGGPVSIVISHRYWQGRLGGRPDVVGSTLRINGFPTTIIGVGEEDFLGARPVLAAADIWIPATVDPRVAPELRGNALEARDLEAFNLVGRLGPGVTPPQAEARLDAMIRQQEIDDGLGEVFEGRRITLVSGGRLLPLRDEDLPVMMALPLIMVGLALVIACSNVGTLLLARGSARAREIAIRLSVGASRGRIVRQLITEATILALLGGVAGLMFGLWSNSTTEWLDPMLPEYMTFELETSWWALLFTLGLSILSGILFGLAPALQAARADVSPALKGGAGGMKRYRWYSMRNFLVLQQVAGSLTLLLLTGFVVLGFGRSSSVEVGFEVDDLYMMSLDPIRDGYTGDQARDFFADLPDRVRQIPGVRAASLTYSIPLGMFSDETSLQASADLGEAARLARQIRSERVGEGFFETIGVELVRGRTFGPTDAGLRVAIVNETMVAETWAGQDPIGQTLEIEEDRYQVIGVAPDFRSGRILETSRMGVFLPMDPDRFDQPSSRGVTVLVRAEKGVDVRQAIRNEIATVDPNLTLFNVSRLRDQVETMMYMVRVTMFVYGGIGVFGLILAAVGLGGVTAYTVAQRTKEIGIRIALGARSNDVLRLVLKEGALMVVIGTVFGQAMAFGTTRALGSYFDALSTITETTTSDPVLLIGAPVLLGTLTMLACYIPARRSTRIDPLVSLRQE